jgi:hypothetical protein
MSKMSIRSASLFPFFGDQMVFSEEFAMLQPRCEICGQPATIHETAVEGEGAVTRHLCQEHGEAALPAVDFGPEAAQAAEQQYNSLSEGEKEHLALLYRLTHRGI